MQTANDADGGNVFPDITAEEAGYSAAARIEKKRERTRDGALRRNVRKRHQISMIRKSFYITVQPCNKNGTKLRKLAYWQLL